MRKKRRIRNDEDDESSDDEKIIFDQQYIDNTVSTNISNTNNISDLSLSFSNIKIKTFDNKDIILKNMESKNSILCTNNEILKISIIQNLLNLYKNSKIIILTFDNKLSKEFIEFIKINNLETSYLQGKKGKKIKNNYNEFREYFKKTDVFISNSDVLYKLLSIGFITIFDLNLIIFDECHNCVGNHPYNLIMTEFYLFYLTNGESLRNRLPKVYGFTSFPFTKIYLNNISQSLMNEMKNLCENMDSQIIMDKQSLDYNIQNIFLSDNEFIEYTDNTNDNKYKILFTALLKMFFQPFIELCLDNYILYSNENLNEEKKKELVKEYIQYLNKLIFSKDFDEFVKIKCINKKDLSINWDISPIYKAYEKIETHIFLIFENLDIYSLNELFKLYLQKYNEEVNKEKVIIGEPEKNKIINILSRIIKGIEHLVKKNCVYKSYKFKKLYEQLNDTKKSLIFVSKRIIAKILELRLIKSNFKASSIVGLNHEYSPLVFNPSNSFKETENIVNDYSTNKISILITTSNIEDPSNLKNFNYIIIYSDCSNTKNYISLKDKSNKENSKLLIFTKNKSKTFDIIDNYININKELINKFDNSICCDFKSLNYIKEKFQNFKYFFYRPETQAKLTLKNVSQIYNEIISAFENVNKRFTVKKNFEEKNLKFKCDMTIQGTGYKEINFKSFFHNDKQSAENECYMRFLINLYESKSIDNNFRLINN